MQRLLFLFVFTVFLYVEDSMSQSVTQNGNKYLSEQNLKSGQGLLTEIDEFPKAKINSGSKKAWMYYDRENESVSLLFEQNNHTFLKKAELHHGLFIDVCYSLAAQYTNDTIWLACVNSNGYEAVSYLIYKHDRLIYLKDTMIDVNAHIKQMADAAYKSNKPVEFLQLLEGAQYYQQFLPADGLQALILADSLCEEYVSHGDYLRAAQLMDSLETGFEYTTSDRIINDCYKIWTKAAFYYVKAGKNEACIRLCNLLITQKYVVQELYLYLGDAQYDLGLKTEAMRNYRTYLELTKPKTILPRIQERLKDL